MEQQIQCPECHTWNRSDKSFCEKCGARLHPFAGEWWKELNMLPVRQTIILYNTNTAMLVPFALLIGFYAVCFLVWAFTIRSYGENVSIQLALLVGLFYLVLVAIFWKKIESLRKL